jgi:hypothetical protein
MGSSNLVARRAAKAIRRKAIVAQKRKAEAAEGSLAGLAARAAGLPIRECLLTERLFDSGMGTLVLVRGGRVGPVTIGVFLIDTFCRGVKDVMVRTVEAEQLETYFERLSAASALDAVEPSFARKLLRDLAGWSALLGFPPHRDFPAAERLFGDVDAEACDASFEFGDDGKPFYVSGPYDSPSQSRRHVEQMLERFGPDGFHYTVQA